ncbi:MAG: transposase [Betaproteobacteria bacterium]|nr:MAG: transposase [Betaproteobacteria bacterium]
MADPGAVSCACESNNPFSAALHGLCSLNAALACKDHERDRLEHLCRHVSRGPIALGRLSIDEDGLVVYALTRSLRDGTTHGCCTWLHECRGR